ncbi:MAG: hypothetical protein EBU34_03445 [Alphaproteobacteria bacterium]|nr:hypothetical protein [Alphaproteobacteria bacterium]
MVQRCLTAPQKGNLGKSKPTDIQRTELAQPTEKARMLPVKIGGFENRTTFRYRLFYKRASETLNG